MPEAKEETLVALGLMRLPPQPKNDDFLDLPAPEISIEIIRNIIRSERDEDFNLSEQPA